MKTATKSMKVYEVDRTKWRRGFGAAGSKLWVESSQCGCCLGLLGLQCGYTKEQLEGKAYPSSVVQTQVAEETLPNLFPLGLFIPDTDNEENKTATLMMAVNDAPVGTFTPAYLLTPPRRMGIKIRSEKHRERKLRELAISIGFRLKFVK